MSNEEVKPLARSADLVTKEVGDEVLVYDLKTHKAHCLNQMAALVWKYCDGHQTVPEIAQLIAQEQNISVDEASVWLALERLNKAQLLKLPVTAPVEMRRLGRRDAIRRLGTGTAIAVPVILSIVAPTALAGCTARSIGSSCTVNCECTSGCCNVRANPDVCASDSGTTGNLRKTGVPCSNDGDCCSDSCVNPPGSGGNKRCA